MRLQRSTRVLLALTLLLTAAQVTPFLLAGLAQRARGSGFTATEVHLHSMLLGALALETLTVGLYAAVRGALRPDFRRDALVLGTASAMAALGWLVVLRFTA